MPEARSVDDRLQVAAQLHKLLSVNDLQRSDRPRARDDVVFRQLDDEWVIYDPASDRLHVLNLTAALVWTYCTGEHDVRAIAREVGRAFDPPVDGERIGDEVASALGTLRAEGLLA